MLKIVFMYTNNCAIYLFKELNGLLFILNVFMNKVNYLCYACSITVYLVVF